MGQINSTSTSNSHRTNAGESSTREATETVNDIVDQQEQAQDTLRPDASEAPSPFKRSEKKNRRESLRKGILGFVRPKSTTVAGETKKPAIEAEGKKRWRRSRRWSKAPVDGLKEASGGVSEEDMGNGDMQPPAESGPFPIPPESSCRPREVAQNGDSGIGNEPTVGSTHGEGSQTMSVSTVPELDGHAMINVTLDDAQPESAVPDNNAQIAGGVEALGSGSESSSHVQDQFTSPAVQDRARSEARVQNDRPIRPFASAGTLVVVQGVVHTSDSARSAHNGASPAGAGFSRVVGDPAPSTQVRRSGTPVGSQRTSLLPSFLRRRHSISSISRSSMHEADSVDPLPQNERVPSVHEPDTYQSVDQPASTSTLASESLASRDTAAPVSEETSTIMHRDDRETAQRQGQLSSNSMDVLGALLSVATAATAASLLSTPSSRPNSSSQTTRAFETPSADALPTHATIPPSSRDSTIPALARALASANPVAAAAIAQREREREREESERHRVRTLWDSLRERLVHGRGRDTTDSTDASTAGSAHSESSAGSRDREHDGSIIPDSLFSELARAFNLGPSQEPQSAQSNADVPIPPAARATQDPAPREDSQADRDVDDAPAGSFERFLIDLQADLRVALTRMDSAQSVESGTSAESQGQASNNDAGRSEDLRTQGNRDGGVNAGRTSTELPGSAQIIEREINEDDNATAKEDEDTNALASSSSMLEIEPTSSVDDGPSLRSSVETTEEAPQESAPLSDRDESSSISADMTSATGEAYVRTTQDRSAVSGSRTGQPRTSNTRGINWWRMYRFPPVRLNQARQQQNLATAVTPDHQNISGTNPSGPQVSHPLVVDSSSMASSVTPELNSLTDAAVSLPPSVQERAANLVVPVIVVGLQSLSTSFRANSSAPLNATGSPSSNADSSDEPSAPTNTREAVETDRASESDTESQRGQNWPSRAARVLGRLGRRGAATSPDGPRNGQDPNGSRTFFIYVIGGYYPPDHHIVTGSDNLESFEALLELAELLGQVKPPVATEEEIEQSGLEVFKASSLQTYENEGRVASNCIERCLICLDDYVPEENLRLLSCKHAFHKDCVDHWLKTGRNNCPACRSKGVRDGRGRSAPSSPI